MRRVLWLALAAASALAAVGCAPPCETSDSAPVSYTTGDSPSAGVYETSPWSGPYLHFPGGRRYKLYHHLGQTPYLYKTYLAFSEHPMSGGNTSESAGNQAVVEAVNDQFIEIRNDQCAEFWLRVVAFADPEGSDAGADAPAD